MAKGIKSLPSPRPAKMVHGTYPPSPTIGKSSQLSVKPQFASMREYGKTPPPLDGTTGLTEMT